MAGSALEAFDEKLAPFVDDERSRHIGLIVVIIAFLSFGIWAVLAPLARARVPRSAARL